MSARISPKHAGHLTHQLAESALFRDLADRASQLRLKAEVEPLSEYLWKSTQSQQDDALQSKFIQGLRYGNLDPTDFEAKHAMTEGSECRWNIHVIGSLCSIKTSGYMVQDSIYCYYSMESIDTAAGEATDPILKAFLENQSESFKKACVFQNMTGFSMYYEELYKLWHIRNYNGIDLSKACEDYVALEKNVAETMGPLCLVLALIPCYKLWPWLGKQVSDQPHNFGVYKSWVMSNLDPTYDGYKKLEQIIDDAFLVGEIDKRQALSIYKGFMAGEATFFSSA